MVYSQYRSEVEFYAPDLKLTDLQIESLQRIQPDGVATGIHLYFLIEEAVFTQIEPDTILTKRGRNDLLNRLSSTNLLAKFEETHDHWLSLRTSKRLIRNAKAKEINL